MAAGEIKDIILSGLDVSKLAVTNATEVVTISNVAPVGVGTATISKWLKVRVEGTDYFIPMWT